METAPYDPTDSDSVLEHARRLAEKRLGDAMSPAQIDSWESTAANKGDMGHAVEHYFGIQRNSESAPDLVEAGIEIKVVPVHFYRGLMTVKERCYLSQVKWDEVMAQGFSGSGAEVKTRKVLFVFYEWVKDEDPLDATILDVALWDRDELVTQRFAEAWDIAQFRLQHGTGHWVSAGDNAVVSASTKGAGTWSPPDGSPEVKARAWAIKEDHMQHVLRNLADIDLMPRTTEAYAKTLRRTLRRFQGWSAEDLAEMLGLTYEKTGYSYVRLVADRLIEYLADLARTRSEDDEHTQTLNDLKAMGLNPRAIRIDLPTLKPAEDISLPNVTYLDVADTPFEDSVLAHETREFALILFSEEETLARSRYVDTVYWELSDAERQMLREDYEAIAEAVRQSDLDARPSKSERTMLRLGTKSQKSERYRQPLPDGTSKPRPNFYIDASYVKEVLVPRVEMPEDLRPSPVRLVREDRTTTVVDPPSLSSQPDLWDDRSSSA